MLRQVTTDPPRHANDRLANPLITPPSPEDVANYLTLPPNDKQIDGARRFEILRLHAWGGLGQVHVARDRELNREVAVKTMHERFAADDGSRTRFLREAEITGRLEHPGIPPVYALGVADDGCPYYAMRFIRGETLKDAIDRYHSDDSGLRSDRRLKLRSLLTRFVTVCETIDFAHSCGIIHRDLKPSNVILGRYGETLVVDWGLAFDQKETAYDAQGTMPTEVAALYATPARTLGSAIGTPAFMSPEQAEGRLKDIGPASDIYSLGATLYALLTGMEPFESPIVGVTLGKVQMGEFPPPRQRNRRVPRGLEAICLKAMELSPRDRYRSSAALARDIQNWIDDEPLQAGKDPLATRLTRSVNRHRAMATGTAALVTTALVGLLIGTALVGRAKVPIRASAVEAHLSAIEAGLQRSDAIQQLYVSQINLAERDSEDNKVPRVHELLRAGLPKSNVGADLRSSRTFRSVPKDGGFSHVGTMVP